MYEFVFFYVSETLLTSVVTGRTVPVRPQDKKSYGFRFVRILGCDLSGDNMARDLVLDRGSYWGTGNITYSGKCSV
jgi:hypothetical protein